MMVMVKVMFIVAVRAATLVKMTLVILMTITTRLMTSMVGFLRWC